MKKIVLLFLLFNYSNLFADPHYVQVLHPYWGDDKIFLEFLDKYKEPVNVVVNKYEGSKDPDDGEDWYIYIYIINKHASRDFLLNIACPGAVPYEIYSGNKRVSQRNIAKIESISSDPIRKTPEAVIDSNKNVHWKLDPTSSRHGMWIYSKSPPAKRNFSLYPTSGSAITGSIDGPACVASDYKERHKSFLEQYDDYCPSNKLWEKGDKIQLLTLWAKKDGCTEDISLELFKQENDWEYFVLSCGNDLFKFKCQFDSDCKKKCWRFNDHVNVFGY